MRLRPSPDLSFILQGIKRPVAALAALSLVAALSEAYLLSTLVQSIAGLRSGERRLTLEFGPAHLTGPISTLLALAVTAAVVRAVITCVVALLGPRIAARARSRQRRLIYASYVNAGWDTQAQEKTGRLMQTFSSSVNDATSFVLLASQAVPALFTLAVVLVVAFVLNPLITAAIAAIGLAMTAGLAPVSSRAKRAARLDAAGRHATAAHVAGSLVAGAEITVMGARRGIIRDAERRIDHAERQFGRAQGFKRVTSVAGQSITFVLAAAGIWVLSVSGAGVDYTVVGTIAILMLRAAGLAQQVQTTLSQYGAVRPFIEQVRTLIENYRAHRLSFGDEPYPESFDLTMDGVQYVYPGTDTVALDVERLLLPAGEFVGVMGPSGAGKSTLIQVLLRLRTPTRGQVRIGGLPIGDISDEEFGHHVAYVPQAPHLVTGTVMENILFYRDWLTEEQAVAAAVQANLHDEVMAMPQGYGTLLDGHVDAVSGGQRQRLSLARALASDPRLLVLDEPTSALDADNERIVLEALHRLRGRTTVVMVTHKRSAVAGCDRIFLVQAGRLTPRPPATAPGQGSETDQPLDVPT